MKKYLLLGASALLVLAVPAIGQQATTAAIEGHNITVKYAAPAAKNLASGSFLTEADLTFPGFNVPKGSYTVYVLADGDKWQLAINKATGAKAATYDPKLNVGKAPMTMTKAGAPAAACKITLTKIAALAVRLDVAWNGVVASTPFHQDWGNVDAEW
jgi:hypothetical protein